MRFEFGFGEGIQAVEIGENNFLCSVEANRVPQGMAPEDEIEWALDNPIDCKKIEEIVSSGEKVAIITSDITRPCPSKIMLPPVLKRLELAGVKDEDIFIMIACGSHRAHTDEERARLCGEEVAKRYRIVDSTPDDVVRLGVTQLGTPADYSREVVEADRRICLGNIEYHYFVGYSGGAKAIMPGVSTRQAIAMNHRFMVDPKAVVGQITDNPVRLDIEEAAAMCGIDFILNVVLDENKQVVKAFAGDWIKAHRVGCEFLDSIYSCRIEKKADIVIASQGGTPKDLNLYQTQKALDNAKFAVRDGGIVILVGRCQEGFGESTFESWMMNARGGPDEIVSRIHSDFQLGGHKAAAIAMVLQRADIFLVSEMDEEIVKRCYIKPFKTVQEAYDAAIARLGENASVITMAHAGSTLPRVDGE